MLPLAVAWSSYDGNAICYLLPILWMTSCFQIMQEIQAGIKDDAYVSSSSPGGGTGDEVGRLLLHLVSVRTFPKAETTNYYGPRST